MSATLVTDIKERGPLLSVGAISMDLMHCADDCAMLAAAGISMLHFDVMDGVFVPQLTVGPHFVKAFGKHFLRDVHLMVSDPIAAIPSYGASGADCITVQVESPCQIHKALSLIAQQTNQNDPKRGIVAGIAILPSTPVTALEPFVEIVDMVTIVTVDPGYSPAVFAESTTRRVRLIREMFAYCGKQVLIGIDGAITRSTMGMAHVLSPDIVVSGSAIFENRLIKENVEALTQGLIGYANKSV